MKSRLFTIIKHRYFLIISTVAVILLGATVAFNKKPTPNQSHTKHESPLLDTYEVSIGNPKAPLTIVMYYSLTCGHCHAYQKDELPKIKKEYIDTGLVRFVYRDFPTDMVAVKAAKIAWCHGKTQYLEFIHKLLESQEQWVPIDPTKDKIYQTNFKKIALENLGIKNSDYEKCLMNQDVEHTILNSSFKAQQLYSIKAAPAFLVNGKVVDEIITAEEIQKILLKMGIHG